MLHRCGIENRKPLPAILEKIDEAYLRKAALVFYAHHIIDGTIADEKRLQVSTEKLERILDHCKARGVPIVRPLDALRLQ